VGRGGGGDGGAGEACGDGDRVAGWGTSSAAGTGWAGSWMAEGLADGEGAAEADDGSAAEADDGSAAEVRVVLAGAAGGAAAAGCPPPSVTASAMPSPLTASTPAAIATPERKLISSMRA